MIILKWAIMAVVIVFLFGPTLLWFDSDLEKALDHKRDGGEKPDGLWWLPFFGYLFCIFIPPLLAHKMHLVVLHWPSFIGWAVAATAVSIVMWRYALHPFAQWLNTDPEAQRYHNDKGSVQDQQLLEQ